MPWIPSSCGLLCRHLEFVLNTPKKTIIAQGRVGYIMYVCMYMVEGGSGRHVAPLCEKYTSIAPIIADMIDQVSTLTSTLLGLIFRPARVYIRAGGCKRLGVGGRDTGLSVV